MRSAHILTSQDPMSLKSCALSTITGMPVFSHTAAIMSSSPSNNSDQPSALRAGSLGSAPRTYQSSSGNRPKPERIRSVRFDDKVVVIKQSAIVYPAEGPAGEAPGQMSNSRMDNRDNQGSNRR